MTLSVMGDAEGQGGHPALVDKTTWIFKCAHPFVECVHGQERPNHE